MKQPSPDSKRRKTDPASDLHADSITSDKPAAPPTGNKDIIDEIVQELSCRSPHFRRLQLLEEANDQW